MDEEKWRVPRLSKHLIPSQLLYRFLAGDRHRFATQIVEFPWKSTTEQVRLASSFVKLLPKFHGSGRGCGSLPRSFFSFFLSFFSKDRFFDEETWRFYFFEIQAMLRNCFITFLKIDIFYILQQSYIYEYLLYLIIVSRMNLRCQIQKLRNSMDQRVKV